MRRWSKIARIMIGALFVVLTVTFAIRSAVVAAYVDSNVALAALIWPNHPDVLASISMIEVAEAAAQAKSVPPETFRRLTELSELSPLSPEPFLVSGASELRDGDYHTAERQLIEARHRAPRSPAARFLLSDLYLHQNRVGPALQELAVVRRLIPSMTAPLLAALVQYVQTAGVNPALRDLLKQDPQLEALLLSALASDYRNADLILSLARAPGESDPTPRWQQKLLLSLVRGGDYERAFQLWRRFAPATETRARLSTFERSSSPSPFTWTLSEGSAGAADPQNGGLQVLFTGRETVTLASRLALFPPGLYMISMRVSGKPPASDGVSWSVTCLPNAIAVANLPLTRSGTLSTRFEVSPECAAQKFELKGVQQTFPEIAEFSISDFQVRRLPI